MKKNVCLLFLSAMVCHIAIASNNQGMVDFMINMMKQRGELTRLSQCLNLSEARLESTLKTSLNDCMQNISIDDQAAGQACMSKHLTQKLNVSTTQLAACEPKEDKIESENQR